MSRPLFSCVMAVKGARPYMDEALASLHSQNVGSDLEVIVQDGDIEPDTGLSDALNKGFAKSQGEWLFWLNADDVLLPNALAKVMADIHSSTSTSNFDSSWIAGNSVTIDWKSRILSCRRDRGSRSAYAGRPVRVYGPSSFFRRKLLEKVGGFDKTLRYAMDSDLWMKFREAGYWFRKVNSYLFAFRIHGGSLTSNPQMPLDEQNRQNCEVERVRLMHGVRMTGLDTRLSKLRRLLDGSYLCGGLDTFRYRGRKVADIEFR